MVLAAQRGCEAALNTLFTIYRRALLAYLGGRKFAEQEPNDIVQEFCASLLRRKFLRSVCRGKGKFRSFLLTCLKRHLIDMLRKRRIRTESLDELMLKSLEEGTALPEAFQTLPKPDQEFTKSWLMTIVENAWNQIEDEATRKATLQLVKDLRPVLWHEENAPSYAEIGNKLGMREGSVRVAASRIRKRWKGAIKNEIMETVASQKDLQEEQGYLMWLLRILGMPPGSNVEPGEEPEAG